MLWPPYGSSMEFFKSSSLEIIADYCNFCREMSCVFSEACDREQNVLIRVQGKVLCRRSSKRLCWGLRREEVACLSKSQIGFSFCCCWRKLRLSPCWIKISRGIPSVRELKAHYPEKIRRECSSSFASSALSRHEEIVCSAVDESAPSCNMFIESVHSTTWPPLIGLKQPVLFLWPWCRSYPYWMTRYQDKMGEELSFQRPLDSG